jgi:hypothetical protein
LILSISEGEGHCYNAGNLLKYSEVFGSASLGNSLLRVALKASGSALLYMVAGTSCKAAIYRPATRNNHTHTHHANKQFGR